MQSSRRLHSIDLIRGLAAVMAISLAACSASTVPARSEAPVQIAPAPDTTSHEPARINVSDAWSTGTANEPAARRVTVATGCNVSPALWILEQNGDSVRLVTLDPFQGQGVPSSPVSHRVAAGRVSGLTVTMTGPDSRFVLRYDTTTGHLRGTLNGAPFWAVPLDVVGPKDCIPPP